MSEFIFITTDQYIARLVSDHLELKRDVFISKSKTTKQKLVYGVPSSYYLIRFWNESRNSRIYQKIDNNFYLRMGKKINQENLDQLITAIRKNYPNLNQDQLILINSETKFQLLEIEPFKPLDEFLTIARHIDTRTWHDAIAPTEIFPEIISGEKIPINLRLTEHKRKDTELWILPFEEQQQLEQFLSQTPESELKNLLITLIVLENGSKWFLIREIISGRIHRLLPLTGHTYTSVIPNLLIPCNSKLLPILKTNQLIRLLHIKLGEIVILDETPIGLRITRIPETIFKSMESVIDFKIEGKTTNLTAHDVDSPFKLLPIPIEEKISKKPLLKKPLPPELPKLHEEKIMIPSKEKTTSKIKTKLTLDKEIVARAKTLVLCPDCKGQKTKCLTCRSTGKISFLAAELIKQRDSISKLDLTTDQIIIATITSIDEYPVKEDSQLYRDIIAGILAGIQPAQTSEFIAIINSVPKIGIRFEH